MFCVYCGTNLPEDARFCLHCGNSVVPQPAAEETPIISPTVREEESVTSPVEEKEIPVTAADENDETSTTIAANDETVSITASVDKKEDFNDILTDEAETAKNPPEQEPESSAEVPKRKKATVIIACACIVAVLAIIVFLFANAEVTAFHKLVENRTYEQALESYHELSSEEQTKVNLWMTDYVSEIEENYYTGKLDYTTAADILEEIQIFDAVSKYAYESRKSVYLDNQSTITLDEAKVHAEKEQWRDAYLKLLDIHIQYRLYDEVAGLKETYLANYRSSVLAQMDSLATSGDYATLQSVRDSALLDIPDDKEIIQKSQALLDNFVEKTLADAEALASAGNFTEAVELLQHAVSMYEQESFWSAIHSYSYASIVAHCDALVAQGNSLGAVEFIAGLAASDSTYESLVRTYADPLVQETLAAAEAQAAARDFSGAINTLNNVANVYSTTELTAAIDHYTQFLPIRLVDCYVVDSSDSWNSDNVESGDWEDSLGNKHVSSLRITCDGWTEYIIYNLDSRYTTFSGTLSFASFYSSEPQTLNFYADDVPIYTSPTISKTTQPITFSLDVSNVKLLKISCTDPDDSSMTSGATIIDADLS